MNRKKLTVFLIAASLVLSGCSIIGIDDFLNDTTHYSSESQTVTPKESETTTSVTPENTEITVSATEKTEPTSYDTEETENTDESGEVSESEENTTTPSSPAVTTAAVTTTPSVTTTTTTATTTSVTTTTTTTAATTPTPVNAEPSPPTIYATTADGILTAATSKAVIDYSNTSDGYVMAKYTGSSSKVKVIVTYPDGTPYQYDLNPYGNYEAFPLTGGNGSYSITVNENISGSSYALAASCAFSVNLSSSIAPYLRPSHMVYFEYGDAVVTKASQLCAGATTAIEKIERIYSWVVENVTYDNSLAADVRNKKITSYTAKATKIINEKKGICYDYAVGIAAMLRSQNVPTQVIFGNVKDVGYHAWVNVYTPETGWVYGAIYFDGSSWRRMDPTLAASSNSSNAIMSFIDTNSNYYSIEKLY